MPSSKPKISKREAERLAILKQAQEMCIPAFCTSLWQAKYGKK